MRVAVVRAPGPGRAVRAFGAPPEEGCSCFGYQNGDGQLVHRRSFIGQLGWPKTLLLLAAFACAVAAMVFAGPPGRSTPAAHAAVAAPSETASPSPPATWRSSSSRSRSPSATSATLTPAEPVRHAGRVPAPTRSPTALTSYGLRTVDGSCNNLFPGRETFAAADVPFPRLTDAGASGTPRADHVRPPGRPARRRRATTQKSGNVVDSQPRVVSNLIVDQTSTNPAAIAAAGFPVRTQGNPGVFPCTTDPDPTRRSGRRRRPRRSACPSHQTLFIPNVTTDVGLSPPYNSLFTFFGQFFDHGVDQTVKSGGTVFVPLKADDPLITLGPDGKAGTGDEVPPSQALHGADPRPEPARARRRPRQRRRHPERQQHRLALGRPEPDLHLALVAPGVPARVRR